MFRSGLRYALQDPLFTTPGERGNTNSLRDSTVLSGPFGLSVMVLVILLMIEVCADNSKHSKTKRMQV